MPIPAPPVSTKNAATITIATAPLYQRMKTVGRKTRPQLKRHPANKEIENKNQTSSPTVPRLTKTGAAAQPIRTKPKENKQFHMDDNNGQKFTPKISQTADLPKIIRY